MMQTMITEDGKEVAIIHFVSFIDENGKGHIACSPNYMDLHAADGRLWPLIRTAEIKHVTCKACKKTDEYLRNVR